MSFLRYIIIAFLFYSSWIYIALPFLNSYIKFKLAYSFIISSLAISSVILITLHPLKRGIHDFISGSIVIRKDTYGREKIEELNDTEKKRRAYKILITILVIFPFAFFFFTAKLFLGLVETPNIIQIEQEISQHTDFTNIEIDYQVSKESGKEKINIFVNAFLNKYNFDDQNLRRAEVNKAVKAIGNLGHYDSITFTARTGFNIGIASYYQFWTQLFSAQGDPVGEPVETK